MFLVQKKGKTKYQDNGKHTSKAKFIKQYQRSKKPIFNYKEKEKAKEAIQKKGQNGTT